MNASVRPSTAYLVILHRNTLNAATLRLVNAGGDGMVRPCANAGQAHDPWGELVRPPGNKRGRAEVRAAQV